jgi:hypothetical protein
MVCFCNSSFSEQHQQQQQQFTSLANTSNESEIKRKRIGKRTLMIKYTCKQLNIQFTYLTVFFFNPRPDENTGRPYRPSASVHAARRSKTTAIKEKKAEREKFESIINQVRARRQATRKASEKAQLLTVVAQDPTKLQLIVDGLVVSQTTQSSIVELHSRPETYIECTEDFSTFDLEVPDYCCVDAAATVDFGTAPAATATAPVAFAPATKVTCGSAPATDAVAAPVQTNMLFGNTQDDTSFNARSFAMSLKRGEKRKYEGVSAAEEITIMCAQFHTTVDIK